MRGLAETNQPRHVAHRDGRLLDQQLSSHVQPALAQLLMKANLAALSEGARELARRAGKRPCNRIKRERTSIVAGDDYPRLQIQTSALLESGGTHTSLSDRDVRMGQAARASSPYARQADRSCSMTCVTRGLRRVRTTIPTNPSHPYGGASLASPRPTPPRSRAPPGTPPGAPPRDRLASCASCPPSACSRASSCG